MIFLICANSVATSRAPITIPIIKLGALLLTKSTTWFNKMNIENESNCFIKPWGKATKEKMHIKFFTTISNIDN